MNKRDYIIFFIASIFFISPNFVHLRTTLKSQFPIYFELSHSYVGDDLHYLPIVASIIRDFDIEISNNYYNAMWKGTNDVGDVYANRWLDHHTLLIDTDTKKAYDWRKVVDFEWSDLMKPPSRVPFRFKEDYRHLNGKKLLEYPQHDLGLSIFLSLFLWPFRWFPYSLLFDSCAMLIISLFSVLALYLLWQVLSHFVDKGKALLFALVFSFCTPVWWYSKALFPESLMFIILVISIWFLLLKKNYVLPGILLGFAIILKPYFGIFGALTCIWLLLTKRFTVLVRFIIPFLVLGVVQFAINYHIMGSIIKFTHMNSSQIFLKTYQHWTQTIFKRINILADETYGFLMFSPFLIYSLIAVFRFCYKRKTLLISLFSIVFFMLVWLNGWMAIGYQYAGRLLVPIIPLFAVSTFQWYNLSRKKILKIIFWFLVVISFWINFQATFMYGGAASKPPWFVVDIWRNR